MSRLAKRQKTATPQIQQKAPTSRPPRARRLPARYAPTVKATPPANEDRQLPEESLTDHMGTFKDTVNRLQTVVSRLVPFLPVAPDQPPTTPSLNDSSRGIMTQEIKRLLLKYRVELIRNITLDDNMWNHLRAAQVVTAAQRDRIQHNKIHDEQIGSLLDLLDRVSDDVVRQFINTLRSTTQNHVVNDFLTPSSHNEDPSTRDIPGANEQRTMTEDNKKLLDDNRKKIIKLMKLNETMWTKLINAKIIWDEKAKWIKGNYRMTKDQVAPFLDHLIRRPEDDFNKFCNILKECDQDHIVDDYLTKK